MVTHPATDPVRPGLTWSLVVKGNALTVYATRAALVIDVRSMQLSYSEWSLSVIKLGKMLRPNSTSDANGHDLSIS